MSQVINETGKIYGELTVLQRANSKNGKAAWLCQCSCGNQIVVRGDSLRSGYNISCGCKAAERMKKVGQNNALDISGQRFGKLIAIRRVGTAEYNGALWECQCDCGNKHIAELSNLKTGKVKSCGCLKSAGEMKIQQLLTNWKISFKTQYSPENQYFSTGYKPHYDFAIFDKEQLICFIEYHGEQHHKFYTNKNTWNNKENFEKTLRRDSEKLQLCKENNIPLYIIWYDEALEDSLLKICRQQNLI